MGEGAPVVVGLVVRVAMIVLFASIFNTFDRSFADNRNKIDIAIQGLKDAYASGERMTLTVHISGYSTTCDSSPTFMIVNSDSGEITQRYNGIPFILCPDGFHSVDRTLTTEGPDNQLGDIVINESGIYKLIVGQYVRIVEKEFTVMSSYSSNSVTSEQVPGWTKVEVKVIDSQDEVDSGMDSIEDITFSETIDLSVRD